MPNNKFYKSKAWIDNSKLYALSKYCICERCSRAVYVDGISVFLPKEKRLRYVVHHKQYLNDRNITDDSVALDWDNLELLCIDCHNNEHMYKSNAIPKGMMFDEDGMLTPHQAKK